MNLWGRRECAKPKLRKIPEALGGVVQNYRLGRGIEATVRTKDGFAMVPRPSKGDEQQKREGLGRNNEILGWEKQ